ncbi:MAG: hypothetical protein QXU21_04400 [Candidatus Bathyarchaeia archaeon]
MHHTIRALGWIIAILWIIILILPVSVAFSLLELLEAENIGLKEPEGFMFNGNVSISIPFYVANPGFYNLENVKLDLQIKVGTKTISTSSAELPNVPAGEMVDSRCNLSLSLKEMLSNNKELLTNDADLNGNASLSFRVASVIAFRVSTGFSIHWGAPLNGLTLYRITYNEVSRIFSISLSFHNNAFFQLNASLLVKLYNSARELIGSTVQNVNVPSQESFQDSLEIIIDDPSKITSEGILRLYLADIQILEEAWEFP